MTSGEHIATMANNDGERDERLTRICAQTAWRAHLLDRHRELDAGFIRGVHCPRRARIRPIRIDNGYERYSP